MHNDDRLDPGSVRHGPVTHVHPMRNLGFGAAVNRAVALVDTDRVVVCNPDITLTGDHWKALLDTDPTDVVTVPLVDATGRPTSVVSRYPTPASHLASGLRLGRWAPRGSVNRRLAVTALGGWGRAHQESLDAPVGRWPLTERWVSGGVFSIDTQLFRTVGGFDPSYFMYYEDVDLCARIASYCTDARAVVSDVAPGEHAVGGSAGAVASRVERVRLDSARRYAAAQQGTAWRVTAAALSTRRRLLR